MQVGVIGGSGSFGVRRCWMIALATAARAVTAPVTAVMISGVAVESSTLFVLFGCSPFYPSRACVSREEWVHRRAPHAPRHPVERVFSLVNIWRASEGVEAR